MKAILIDPTKREIKGIEIDSISAAFGNKKVMLVTKMIGQTLVLCYDAHARLPSFFWYYGVRDAIQSKGILLGRERGVWPVPITLDVRDVECLVKFGS